MLEEMREKVIAAGLEASGTGLVTASMGNFSILDRASGLLLLTPGGIPYPSLRAADIVVLDKAGNLVDGFRPPSSEKALHLSIYACREDVGGICHTHPPFATAWAACGRALPPLTAEFASHKGAAVLCAPYEPPGSAALATVTCRTLGEQSAVLMEKHGLTTVGPDLEAALATALVVEHLARVAFYAHCLGGPGG